MDRDTQQPTLTERVARIEAFISDGKPQHISHEGKLHTVRFLQDTHRKNTKTEYTSTFEEIMKRIQDCTDRVAATASNLETIGIRIFNVEPEQNTDQEHARKIPAGMFENTLLALDYLDESLSRLQRAAAHIEHV